MGWSGYMKCHVVNETGWPITQVYAAHTWNSITHDGNSPELMPGDSFPFDFQCGAGGNDEWSVRFIDHNGSCWHRNEKQCNVEEGDYESKDPVYINLLPSEQGFSIEMPHSSSCNDNRYDRC